MPTVFNLFEAVHMGLRDRAVIETLEESPAGESGASPPSLPSDAFGPEDARVPDVDWQGGIQKEIHIDDVARFSTSAAMSIRDVITRIDQGHEGLALVIDEERRLVGTITDGDIRRALLAGLDLEQPCGDLLQDEAVRPHAEPITAAYGTSPITLLGVMGKHGIRHVPLLDKERRVVGLALLSRLVSEQQLPLRAVIMAGGLGARLRPLTEDTPKPMLPVGDRPLLERTVEQLGQAGIRQVEITTHYLADKIRNHIGDGSTFGTTVAYRHEAEALGTAGALRNLALPSSHDPLLVINGDVLTSVNFRALFDYHCAHEADITVGVRRYSMKVPYGVVEGNGARVEAIREKPEVSFFVNAGIYLLEPEVCREIPEGKRFDMTDLIDHLIGQGRTVVSFPIHEYWLDIGRLGDYEQAQQDVSSGKLTA